MAILADYDNLRPLVTTPHTSLIPQFLLADTAAELPTSSYGLYEGCRAYAKDTNSLYLFDGAAWNAVGGAAAQAFPVGSVFISVVPDNPASLLGYGTWEAFAAGKFLVGLDAADPDFDTAEETGGAKTVTLTAAMMPVHTHVQDTHNHALTELRDATTGAASTNIALTADTSSTLGTKVSGSRVATNQNAGSGGAHANLPPFVVCAIWRRTA